MAPGLSQKVSQLHRPAPSARRCPSIWYEAVATPQVKLRGKAQDVPDAGSKLVMNAVSFLSCSGVRLLPTFSRVSSFRGFVRLSERPVWLTSACWEILSRPG